MTEPRMQVAQVPEGSIILLVGLQFEDVDGMVVPVIAEAVGHNKFAVVMANAGRMEVVGPDDDLAARVRALLADAEDVGS